MKLIYLTIAVLFTVVESGEKRLAFKNSFRSDRQVSFFSVFTLRSVYDIGLCLVLKSNQQYM